MEEGRRALGFGLVMRTPFRAQREASTCPLGGRKVEGAVGVVEQGEISRKRLEDGSAQFQEHQTPKILQYFMKRPLKTCRNWIRL